MESLTRAKRKDKQMASVGDRVTIEITGPAVLANTASVTGTVSIGNAAAVRVSGRISQDLGENWLIELDVSIAGNNRISVPKSSLRQE